MFSTERQLVVGSSSGTLQAGCSQLRLSLPAHHVHAARSSRGKRHSLGIAAAPRTPRAVGSSRSVVVEEEVDAIAVLERPGAVPSTHFEHHDQAMQQLQELVAFNTELSSAIADTDVILEQTSWGTLTLPPTVKKEFTEVYREERKKEEKQFKEERRKRAAQREQLRAARAQAQQADPQAPLSALGQPPAPTQPSGTEQPFPALQEQPQPVAQMTAAALSSPAAAHRTQRQRVAQPLAQQPLQQPQPAQRTRRSRSSATVAPAALSRSVLSSISALPSSVPASSSSSNDRRPAPAVAATPAAASAAPTPAPAAAAVSAAPVAPAAGRTSSRTRAARSAATPSAVASPSSNSSSTSAELAVASPVQQAATSGFVPLPVLQSRNARAPVPSTSRRVQRAAGVGRRSSVATAAVSANPMAPALVAAKLADNTIHGLDMRAELLTGEQEKDLAVMVQDLLHLEQVAKDLAVKLGRTPTDMEWMEAADAQGNFEDITTALTGFQQRVHAGRSAKQVMIKANYKLVVSICRKYQGLGMNMGDLINEGIAGLVKGVERFEPSKGFKFSTYAHWWIRQSVSRSLADQGRLVRLPIHMQELLSRALKASRAFEAKHGRDPSAEELAPELGVEASRIKDAWEAVTNPRSLDQPMGSDADGGTLGDVVEDDRTIGSEEAVYIESLKKDLEGVLAGLSGRDAGVLRMRFGLLDGREYTLDEVGAEFNVTRERIRQIEAKAIRSLRAHHISPGSVMADYQFGPMSDKQLASRTSSGTKKQK